MTQAEFARGWKLLIVQPWGWRYNKLDERGNITEESKTQLEFYYEELHRAHPEAWLFVAKTHARGDGWPSVNELQATLTSIHHRYVKALPKPKSGADACPPEVREKLAKIGVKVPA